MTMSGVQNGAERAENRVCVAEKRTRWNCFLFSVRFTESMPSHKLYQFRLRRLSCLFLVPEILLPAAAGTKSRYQILVLSRL